MADSRPPGEAAAREISPARAALAVAVGWLLPGAGHAMLGRLRRAALFFVLILGSFGLGLAHDGRLALYNDKERFLTGLQLLANVGIGPADAFARRSVYGEVAYAIPQESDPTYVRRIETFRKRQRSAVSAYGTAYLWTAGLMNLLLLLDVWDIAMRRKD
ncbi:MAG TPA: DUF6677 family protein [Candidatus Polarisedimenticolaceae bacterium]|nr:DUF6677 family protein [Candidatus Polarisedimenticolaceae bacterium]